MAAASKKWNSGRFVSIRPIVSPRPSPIPARPAATRSTLAAYSPQVMLTSSSLVLSATLSALSRAVVWNASATVAASRAVGRSVVAPSTTRRLPDLEAFVGQPVDVVREPDEEHEQHQHHPDESRPLHDAERDRFAADLLDDRPEDVAAVERQEREQVDDRQRQRDQGEDADRVGHVVEDRLAGHLVGADDAADLLAPLGIDQVQGKLDGLPGDQPEAVDREVERLAGRQRDARAALRVGEAQPWPRLARHRVRVEDRRYVDPHAAAVALDQERGRLRGLAAVPLGPRAAVRLDLPGQHGGLAALAVDRDDPVGRLELLGRRIAALDLAYPVRGPLASDRPEEDEQQHEGEDQVDRGPRRDHHDPLPDGLRVVGASPHLVGEVLVGVHPADLHVAPRGDRADAVLGLPHLLARQDRGEEEREALDPHADGLGRGEVPQLVEDDQEREADEGEQPAHAATPRETARASASASYRSENSRSGRAWISPRVLSITRGIPVKPSSLRRTACTATSLA